MAAGWPFLLPASLSTLNLRRKPENSGFTRTIPFTRMSNLAPDDAGPSPESLAIPASGVPRPSPESESFSGVGQTQTTPESESFSDAGQTRAVLHTAVIETQYLPPLETFARLLDFPRVRFEAHEHWVKRSYRNRSHVAGPSGLLVMSIPLVRRGGDRRLSGQVQIAYAQPWLREHWNTLVAGYRRSPFFEYYEDRFEPLFNAHYHRLIDRNTALFQFFADALGWSVDIGQTEYWDARVPMGCVDFRNAVLPSGGRPDPFYRAPDYGQVFAARHGFLPGMSMADLLFNEGPASREILRRAMGH